MPLYEYECMKCGERFEELDFSDSKKAKCPKCGSDKIRKLIGNIVHFSFKGVLA